VPLNGLFAIKNGMASGVEILKLIVGVPKWVILLSLRLLAAVLNLFPCPWITVCKKEQLYGFLAEYQQVVPYPELYIVQATRQLRLGHWIVALVRGKLQQEIVAEASVVTDSEGFSRRHQITNQVKKKIIYESDLDTISKDCEFLS
jgi:hypothetical protein